ncbi:MAG: tetratricopeptide repeat protein [Gemmatimonadota bacterium]|nr:tetratricopeptide repeat protein [Gemmatimonadota bacterium]
MTRARIFVLPAALLAAGGCFATREDVRLVQTDLQAVRAERARSDSAVSEQIARVAESVGAVDDSVQALGIRLTRMQGEFRGDLHQIGQQLIMIQELSGQSQRRLQELRASLEDQSQAPAATTEAPPPGAAAGTPPSGQLAGQPANPVPPPGQPQPAAAEPGTPGPNSLFQLSLDQLRRGSAGAARAGFEELLRLYPNADIAVDAQFYIGEAHSAEGNAAGADTAYATVTTRFPNSPRAATAMYKRALGMATAGNNAAALMVLNELVTKYPRSDEAALARERLRTMP